MGSRHTCYSCHPTGLHVYGASRELKVHLQGPLVALSLTLPVSIFTALNETLVPACPRAVAKMRAIRNVLQSVRCVT